MSELSDSGGMPIGMTRASRVTAATVAGAVLCFGCTDDDPEAEQREPSCAEASDYDTTIPELAERWWQWILKPVEPPDSTEECVNGLQDDGIWFLAGTTGGEAVTRRCTIPKNTALFISPVSIVFSPCPEDEGCTTPTDPAELVSGVTSQFPSDRDAIEARLVVDGEELERACASRGQTAAFKFTHDDPDAACLGPYPEDICPELSLSGDRDAAADGLWSLVSPLPGGEHELRMTSETEFGTDGIFAVDVTYELEVQD
jgi:hypothetical protein